MQRRINFASANTAFTRVTTPLHRPVMDHGEGQRGTRIEDSGVCVIVWRLCWTRKGVRRLSVSEITNQKSVVGQMAYLWF